MIDTYGTVRTDPAEIRADGCALGSQPTASDDEIMTALGVDPRGTQPDRPACAGMDPSIFFPEIGENADEARAVCATCPARPHEACLTFALEHHERHCVWAGLTEDERRPLLRLLAIPRPAPVRCQADLHDLTEANTDQGNRCKRCNHIAHNARRARNVAKEAA